MSELKIHGALVQAVVDAAFGLPCAYEGEAFAPVQGEPWMRVLLLPADAEPSSLGVGGTDEHLGVFQIDFNYAPDKGVATLLQKADAARAVFVAGKRFFKDGQCVLIRKSVRSSIRSVDGWSRVTVSVYYSAQSIRPEV